MSIRRRTNGSDDANTTLTTYEEDEDRRGVSTPFRIIFGVTHPKRVVGVNPTKLSKTFMDAIGVLQEPVTKLKRISLRHRLPRIFVLIYL